MLIIARGSALVGALMGCGGGFRSCTAFRVLKGRVAFVGSRHFDGKNCCSDCCSNGQNGAVQVAVQMGVCGGGESACSALRCNNLGKTSTAFFVTRVGRN
jgi:hypothetical protein